MFDHKIIEAIKADAIERFPEESCGLVLKRTDGAFIYKPTPNIANEPTTSFHIDSSIVLTFKPALAAIVHSHPNGPDCPSETDMRQQVELNVPFGIVSTDGVACLEPFFWGGDYPLAPIIGRGFRHGVTDCYALIRDYFKINLDVSLSEYPREWEWWLTGENLYEKFFGVENFRRISESEVKEHDCFLASLRSPTPNHAGIYVGNNLILHHISSRLASDPSRLSRREPISTYHKFICGFWVRHESQF